MTLRPATLEDLGVLRQWDAQPHIVAAHVSGAWGDEEELAHRSPHCQKLMACIDGQPAGFVQILDPVRDRAYWGDMTEDGHAEGLRAIDLWIGEAGALGRGYGTQMMRMALERCFAEPEVVAVLVDPLVTNIRACRFYERLGFRLIERRHFGDDDCCVYRLERASCR
jgi:aminoglycoside 6'-N-acetyltransferase